MFCVVSSRHAFDGDVDTVDRVFSETGQVSRDGVTDFCGNARNRRRPCDGYRHRGADAISVDRHVGFGQVTSAENSKSSMTAGDGIGAAGSENGQPFDGLVLDLERAAIGGVDGGGVTGVGISHDRVRA